MAKGVITLDYKGRLVDRLAKAMYKMKLFETDGYYPVLDNNKSEVAAFVCIKGAKPVVRFLEWITDYRDKNARKVTIEY